MGLLTKGHIIACNDRNRRGGIKTIYLGEVANIDSVTTASPHSYSSITGFTAAGTELLYKFEFDRETAYFTANATKENGSTVVEAELGFTIPKINATVNARLEELKDTCGLVAIVESYADDGTNTYHFTLGYDEIFAKEAYMEFLSGEQNTGQGLQDPNETVVKLKGMMAEYPREYTGTVTVEVAGDNSYSCS
jgi:hypothetical protein